MDAWAAPSLAMCLEPLAAFRKSVRRRQRERVLMNNLIHNFHNPQQAAPNKLIQYTIPENQSRMFWSFVCQRQLKKNELGVLLYPDLTQNATSLLLHWQVKRRHFGSSKQWSELSELSELNKRQQYDNIHGRRASEALRPATHYWGQLCDRCQILGISDQALLRNWSFRCSDSWSLKALKRFVCACHHPAAGE